MFNLALGHAIRKLPVDAKDPLFYKSKHIVAYASVINIMSRLFTPPKEIFINFTKATNEVSLTDDLLTF